MLGFEMKGIVSTALAVGILGLVVGYLVFARDGGGYMNPIEVFFPGGDLLSQIGDTLSGGERIRRNVLLSGAVGAVVGAAFRLGQGYRGR